MVNVSHKQFHYLGRNFIIMVDCFSGNKWVVDLNKLDMTEVIKTIKFWFTQRCGLPRVIRSNSGPQFQSEYKNWLISMCIVCEPSSAYYPQ